MEGIVFDEGRFCFDPNADKWEYGWSSGAKWSYRGVYRRYKDDADIPAVAIFSHADGDVLLAREQWVLGCGEHAGFGPRLFAHAAAPHPAGGSEPLAVAIEEDVGISLASALSGATLPGVAPIRIESVQNEAGRAQAAKILYDVGRQVFNMHRCGLYHHDLKTENVCVRSVGPDPWDIRATIIDFDRTAHESDGRFVISTEAYRDFLFRVVPEALGATLPLPYMPTSLERDVGCLAVVAYEIMESRPLVYRKRTGAYSLDADGFLAFLEARPDSFFSYFEDGRPRARELIDAADLRPLALEARLLNARELAVAGSIAKEASLFKNGQFFDRENARRLEDSYRKCLGEIEDLIARSIFENYNTHLRERGERVKHPVFDRQPADLMHSNYAQAAGFVSHVWRLGCEIVDNSDGSRKDVLDHFDDEEIEILARWEHERWTAERKEVGWRYGETGDGRSDPAKRLSPSLKPYDELDDAMKEFNRRPMREMIGILREHGLGVRRRSGMQSQER